MRNIDKNIEQKIILTTIKNKSEKEIIKSEKRSDIVEFNLDDDDIELNRLKLRLRFSKSLSSKYSEEEDEYNYVRSLNQQLNIQSIQEYNEKEKLHSHYIKNPEEYFKKNGVWKNLYDFLGTNTSNFLKTKDEWKSFCKENKYTNDDEYNEGCKKYVCLPKEPSYFYKDFTNISNELMSRRRR